MNRRRTGKTSYYSKIFIMNFSKQIIDKLIQDIMSLYPVTQSTIMQKTLLSKHVFTRNGVYFTIVTMVNNANSSIVILDENIPEWIYLKVKSNLGHLNDFSVESSIQNINAHTNRVIPMDYHYKPLKMVS